MRAAVQKRPTGGQKLRTLGVVYLTAHTGCDCRCVMCDIWRADQGGVEMSLQQLDEIIESLKELKVPQVVISGGEPLKHTNLWTFCRALREAGIRVGLVSTGMLLEMQAEEIAANCDQLTVPLDGSPAVHDRIRQVNGCASQLAAGIRALLRIAPDFPITAQTVVQKQNCGELAGVVRYGSDLGLKGIGMVAADLLSTAFNRPGGWDEPKIALVALNHGDLCKLSRSIELLLTDFANDFERGFILTSPRQLWDIYRYYKALLGQCDFPPVRCNAPWTSAVVDADGTVRPCFFHQPYGKLTDRGLEKVLNDPDSIRFRRELRVTDNEICRKCVYSTSRISGELLTSAPQPDQPGPRNG